MANPADSTPIAILDSLSFAITSLRLDGTIEFVNEVAAKNLSGTRDALVGKSIFDFFPDHAAATRERIRQTASRNEVQHFESVVTLPDGTEKFFDSAYHPALDTEGKVVAVQIVAMDVSHVRRPNGPPVAAESLWGMVSDDLSMTAERLAAIFENLPMVIGIHDRDMTIRYMNWVVEGVDIDEVIGSSPMLWLAEEGQRAMTAAYARVIETGQMTEFELDGGSGRRWLARLVPLFHESEVRQILSCTIEITALSRLEAQLRHRQKIESLGVMAGGIAHDFNNLLTAIMGNVGLAQRWIKEGRSPEEFLLNIETASQKAAGLCEQMLAYAGRDRPRLESGNLNQVVEDMANLTRAAVNSMIQIHYELDNQLPTIQCSKSQLGQVVLNLINNAADAIGDGHGLVTVTTDLLPPDECVDGFLPESPSPGRYVRLRVTDTGRGMDAEVQPLIFDPFYSTKTSGHGLGLSAVLGIVSSHEAVIKVESEVDEGTTVTLLFPAGANLATSSEAPASDALWIHGEGRVLVVDDEAAVRRMAALVLREAGYEVLEAGDGDEALALLKTCDLPIHAVLLDVTMPRRDGCSTLEELRRRHPSLPVLLSSGKLRVLTESQKQDSFLRLLHKPYLPDALVGAVADAVGSRNVGSEKPDPKT